jgi:hypothetical protein
VITAPHTYWPLDHSHHMPSASFAVHHAYTQAFMHRENTHGQMNMYHLVARVMVCGSGTRALYKATDELLHGRVHKNCIGTCVDMNIAPATNIHVQTDCRMHLFR